MKLKALVASIGVFALTANAGEYVDAKAPIVEEQPLGATISTGYMTNYIFYGVDFGEQAIWTGIDYTITELPIPVNVGVWYINPTEGAFNDELDVYAGINGPSFAGFDTSLTFTAFFFPEIGTGHTYELALGVTRSLGIVDFNGSARYDFQIEGFYFDLGLSKTFGVTDSIDLVLSTGVGYTIDYFAQGGGFNHTFVQASLPIALRSNVTLTPYVAGLFSLEQTEAIQEDIVHGGVSISVSF